MKIFREINFLKEEIKRQKSQAKIIGLVPTMGAIHSGHLSLIDQIKNQADIIIGTIFINPKQFDNQLDYQKYPQDLEMDIEKFRAAKVDILFIPEVKEIYPDGLATSIKLNNLTNELCGKTRPGHFDGVALIIVKLFNIIEPNLAIFGEKDFQQLQVIKKLNEDLNFNIQIIGAKIIREESGLAMSSRNLRLDDISKKIAPKIYQILLEIKQKLLKNSDPSIESIMLEARERLIKLGFSKIDYLEIRDEKNLELLKEFDLQIKSRIFIAVYLNQIRLIDNLELQ